MKITLKELIHDQLSYSKNLACIDVFKEIYTNAFPDINEREDWAAIEMRICSAESTPRTFAFFDNHLQTAGGIIADYYAEIGVVHLIYIAVKPEERGTGIAKRLIKDLLPKAIRQMEENYDFQAKAILFESNIPWLTQTDSIDPSTRLQIFEHFGAKAIPIKYTQPALEIGKMEVSNLFLLTFPLSNQAQQTIETTLLLSFLEAFYRGLGVQVPTENQAFNGMRKEILKKTSMNQITLTGIAQMEKPQIRLKKAAVCVQFTVVDDNTNSGSTLCPAFYSYETDLLSAHFQKRRPFESKFNEHLAVMEINIHYPEQYVYLSEGKQHLRYSERQTIPARLHINKTKALNGNTATYSIVISTAKEADFSELECIKLLNFFGSKQENVRMIDEIQWSTTTIAKCSFLKFMTTLLGIDSQTQIEISSGILQTDTAHINFVDQDIQFDWSDFYLNLKRYHENHELAEQQYERTYYNDAVFQAVNNIFCGFALGIFDFERMDFDEVTDTLIPRKANENYLLLLNRGILLCACHDDDMFAATLDSIGMSPYLLIPNMVLVNNEFTLSRIDYAIEKLYGSKNKRGQIALTDLRNVREEIDHWLHDNYLPNVFQYPSEKDLYEFGTNHRGLLIYKANLENNIQTLDDLKDELIANRQENSDLMMTLILTLLSGVQFQEMFQSFVNGDFILSWMWTIFFSLTLTGAIYYFTKLKMRR